MSHFTTVRVEVNDLDAIRSALDAMQITWQDGGTISDFCGRSQAVALAARIDGRWALGFVEQEDGGLEMVADFWGLRERSEAFLDRFRVAYGRAKVTREAESRGFLVVGEEARDNGEVVLTLRRYV